MPSLLPDELRKLDTPLVSSSLLDRAEGAPAARTPPPLRPPREEIERRIAAGRRRRAREEKAARTGRLLDEELELYNRALARKIADAGRSDGIAPILKDALEQEPDTAGPQVDHLIGELRRQAPEQAEELERELGERRPAPRRRVDGSAPDPSLYMEFPEMPEITEAEDVGFWESFLPNIWIGMTTDPWKEGRIIQEHFPDEVGGIRADKFGNPIITFRGKDYYINKPGFSLQDFGTVTNAIGAATAGGRVIPAAARIVGSLISGSGHGPGTGSGVGGVLAASRLQTAPIAGQQGGSEPSRNESPYSDIVDSQPSGPPPSTPPDPEDQGQILVNVPPDLEELLTQIPPTPGFTLADKDDIVEIFPDQRGDLPQSLIIERRGSPRTQALNELIRKIIQEILKARGYENFIKHRGGAIDQETAEPKKEFHLKGRDTGNLRGGSFDDLTFKNILNKRHLRINTVDPRADRLTESTREHQAGIRILRNGRSGDLLLLVPKLLPGEEVDEDYLREVLEQLIDELLGPKPEQHPNDTGDYEANTRRLDRPPVKPQP
jgi:hypothetical protein